MANKYAKQPEIEQKKTIIFSFVWTGDRTPEFIKLPNDKKVKVSTMKNGNIILEDGSIGTYKRIWDDNKTNSRSIVIELEIE